jgi:hypothetical protein
MFVAEGSFVRVAAGLLHAVFSIDLKRLISHGFCVESLIWLPEMIV